MIRKIGVLWCFVCFSCVVIAQKTTRIGKWHETFEEVIYTDFKAAKQLAFKAIFESEKLQNDTLLLEAYTDISHLYLQTTQLDSSLHYTDKALDYAKVLGDREKEAILYNRKGKLARINSDFKIALRLHEKALYLSKNIENRQIEVDVMNGLAILYNKQLEKAKVFKVLEEARQIAISIDYKKGLAENYNTKGLLLFAENQDNVENIFKEGISITKADGNRCLEGIILSNLGDYYLEIREDAKAISTLNKATNVAKEVGDRTTLSYVEMSKNIYRDHIGEYQKAVVSYKNILKEYKQILNNTQRLQVYWLLSGVLWDTKAFEEAFDYQERYIYLNDSIFNLEKAKEFENLRTEYEVEKKEHQIVTLEKEKALERSRKQWILVSAILLILPLIILFLFYRNRAKTQNTIRLQEQKLHAKEKERLEQEKALKETQALVAGQDKERERIAKELHDGVGGQLASINLNVSHINTSLKHPSLTAVNHALKDTFKELRALSHDLSYNYHQDKSMYQLLAELKQNYTKSHGLLIDVSIFPKDCLQMLDVYTKHNLYRILQEVLANTAKHAKSQHVSLSINRHEAALIIVLEDDGIGFDVNTQKGGIGLKNIRERVMSINGKLTIDSVLGQGTSVIIEILTDTVHQ